jgi:hypothetical protein
MVLTSTSPARKAFKIIVVPPFSIMKRDPREDDRRDFSSGVALAIARRQSRSADGITYAQTEAT